MARISQAWSAEGSHNSGLPMQGTGTSASRLCSDEEIDVYAQDILQGRAAQTPDDSLGSYVASLLRASSDDFGGGYDDVRNLPEFESLVELIQEHCACSEADALDSLQSIAEAVRTRQIPHPVSDASSSSGPQHAPPAFVANPQQSFDQQDYGDKTLTKQIAAASPLHVDDLIPVDLMGVLDDPATPKHHRPQEPSGAPAQQPLFAATPAPDETAFPPLGTASANMDTGNHKKKAVNRGSGVKSQLADDLAASLFVPSTRSRQSSIDETSPSLQPAAPSSTAPSSYYLEADTQQQQEHDDFQMALYGTTVELLLSMNSDVSEDAALAATTLASGDVNVAQYVIDCVLQAPPICRHLLQNGCYRSDCQFSHDIDSHTCVFWLRGNCNKGGACRFLHGFAPQLLDGLYDNQQEQQQPQTTAQQAPPGFQTQEARDFPPPGFSPAGENLSRSIWSNGAASRGASSFANVASQGYSSSAKFVDRSRSASVSLPVTKPKKVDIPQDVWSAHENRDASAFHISDPMERYRTVAAMSVRRDDVVDLHFQSTKTFATVLHNVLPMKFDQYASVWVVTGTGHHVGSRTHQKGGGALESAVSEWLAGNEYEFARGRDRNGQSGALLVYNPYKK